jgi:hypothetical protein|tara:strand:- start:904 stop:1056 length:153 start_codon:yes stop_codon:yes gene_type:complete
MTDDIAEVIITQIVLKLEKFSNLIEKNKIDELRVEIDILKDEVSKYGRDN